MSSQLMVTLASFGIAYAILDAKLLESIRSKFWPNADCYFCVGFWAGMVLEAMRVVRIWDFPVDLPEWKMLGMWLFQVILIGLASCGVSGFLGTLVHAAVDLPVFVDDEEEGGR